MFRQQRGFRASRARQWTELLVIFGLVPCLMVSLRAWAPLLAVLCLVAAVCVVILRRDPEFHIESVWRFRASMWRANALVFCGAAAALTLILWRDDQFLAFPRNATGEWLLLALTYPVLSVLPQELIFRTFFFHRYREIFDSRRKMILASAVAFSFAHIAYQNWVAVLLTFAGGLIFARSYAREASLPLVWAEHSAYGLCIFTLGLAQYLGGPAL